MHRRKFLCYQGISLVSVAAFNFGCSIKSLVNESSDNIALIYGTRYGATKDTAQWIAQGIGTNVDVVNIEEISFDKFINQYDKIIIGSGIWIDGGHKRFKELFSTHKGQIQSKIIASFIVCGTTGKDDLGMKRIESYFEKFYKPLDTKPKLQRFFGGRMIIEQLTEKDRKLLDNFYQNILKKEFISWDRTQPKLAKKFGMELINLRY